MNFDLVVIGSGPGGQHAAFQAVKAGKTVAVVEERESVGGACIHSGTVPSKSFRESIYRWAQGSQGTLGLREGIPEGKPFPRIRPQNLPDMKRLLKRRDRAVCLEAIDIQKKYERNQVKVFHGRGKLISPHEIEVTQAKGVVVLKAKVIIIAVGARPVPPKHITVDGVDILDSHSVLSLKSIPRSMVVLGAGVIGCEYASMFVMAGTQVSLVDQRNEVLASIDREIVSQLTQFFERSGMEMILETECVEIKKHLRKTKMGETRLLHVYLKNGRRISAEKVMVALGRQGNTENLGLEALGIKVNARGLIQVNSNFQTEIGHIYAVGDVIGLPALASTSYQQGRIAACHGFKVPGASGMPELYPYGIYTIPEISTVGETEDQVKKKGIDYVVGKAYFRQLARGLIVGDQWGLLKLIVNTKTLKILGVHIIGDSAADIVHIGQSVMTLGGQVTYFTDNVFNFPTYAEAYKVAAFNAVNKIRTRPKLHLAGKSEI